ncbi:TPA: conjugal transfer protein TraF [Vibrio parahaemolyticus]|uniref:conjugal transfer protein TraF n=1 Tax=Vibrio parahaemolyticus TaxID=670 RepID=UPI0006495910|nr:conjugal transfer protein TraF [Vibrio parahaemolyticus]EGR1985571.1 type IX secretion system membrane protein PorP/SprF [Vibrio parahaemolyticus]EII3441971.1 conjugal transfer protein TraF [Vibrio parahaemolyticus]EKC5522324.1 conjugal transfer protein TraF [Vibrio parahaemolyticus]ELA7838596.1 conjugal transfer protein TraF [Vibrio parahaemolyticus]MCX8879344.1 conjugal transfer protein TraF [Vibrio parahaemolyticus]
MRKTTLAVTSALTLLSLPSFAAPYAADARSHGMGNTGVVSADYLTAPLHNPALGALYRENDDIGLLIPAFGVNIHDEDDALSTVDDVQDLYDSIQGLPTPADEAAMNQLLDQLDSSVPIVINGGLTFAIAIPTRFMSMNLFSAGYVEILAAPDISDATNTAERYLNSAVNLAAFGSAEYGVSLSRTYTLGGQTVAFGLTPKYQQLKTYTQRTTLDDFDIEDYDKSEVSKNAFNMDVGIAWYHEAFRAGLSVKDVFKQDIKTKLGSYTYELTPQATVGIGYVSNYVALSLDADLTTQKRFKELDDDTQFVRIGIEGDAWGWAQLRAGYEIDLENNLDNSVTGGIGISPFDVVSLDLAGSYAGDNQFGAAANLAFTF